MKQLTEMLTQMLKNPPQQPAIHRTFLKPALWLLDRAICQSKLYVTGRASEKKCAGEEI